MVTYRLAMLEDAEGIVEVCSAGYRNTYPGLLTEEVIEAAIREFYTLERITGEIENVNQHWNGWFAARDQGRVVGAAGGGMTADGIGELYVIYLDPSRKREGIGSKLLELVTEDQMKRGAKEQWVSVAKDNQRGIPFYEAKGFTFQLEVPSYGKLEELGYRSLRYWRRIG